MRLPPAVRLGTGLSHPCGHMASQPLATAMEGLAWGFSNQGRKPVYGFSLVPLVGTDRVRRLYRVRAHMEAVMRACKDQLGLTGCQARSERAQRHHIACCVVARCILLTATSRATVVHHGDTLGCGAAVAAPV